MKRQKPVRRQIFVLTPEEKKAVCCVIAALLLGLATKHYRATHPSPPPPLTASQQRAAKIAERTAAARAKSARGEAIPAPAKLTPEEREEE